MYTKNKYDKIKTVPMIFTKKINLGFIRTPTKLLLSSIDLVLYKKQL